MTFCKSCDPVPHVPAQQEDIDLDDTLDESRSILNAARCGEASHVSRQEHELAAESVEPGGQQPQQYHQDTQQEPGSLLLYKDPGRFASEALDTLKTIQAMINMELGRDVRTFDLMVYSKRSIHERRSVILGLLVYRSVVCLARVTTIKLSAAKHSS
jgi:hypothetical protein